MAHFRQQLIAGRIGVPPSCRVTSLSIDVSDGHSLRPLAKEDVANKNHSTSQTLFLR